jgi:DNA repair protein RecO (recombination protein O)
MLTKDRAVCLRCVDYSETSQVVTLFAEQAGKLAAIAKGSRRPKSAFDGPVEIFSFGSIVYQPARGGQLGTLTEFQQQPVFRGIRSSLYGLQCGLCAAELVEALTIPADPNPSLFESLVQFLTDLQSSAKSNDQLALLILFQLRLLQEIGLLPILQQCANCSQPYRGNWRTIFFAPDANGLVCPDCESAYPDKLALSRPAADALADLHRLQDSSHTARTEIEKFLLDHFTRLIHRPLKTASAILSQTT